MNTILTIFLGAGIGGVLRHGMNLAALRYLGSGFPFGTLAVNILGSFTMGLFVAWFSLRGDPGQLGRLFLTTGLLGGFTTFSAFSLDTGLLLQRGEIGTAAFYALTSVILSIAALFLGMGLIRAIS